MVDETEVPIEFNGKRDHISERMQAHAIEKIGRLARYRDRLTRIEVVADHAHENPEIEMVVHLKRGAPVISKDRGTSFSATIDLLVDKVETQLRKQKEKQEDRSKGRGEAPAKNLEPDATPPEETYEDIVRKSMRK